MSKIYPNDNLGRAELYMDMRRKRVSVEGVPHSHTKILQLSREGYRFERVSSDAKRLKLRVAQ